MSESSVATIEHDIADLEHRLAEKKAALSHEISDREVIHGIIGEKIKEHVPQYSVGQNQQNQSGQLPNTGTPKSITVEPPSYMSDELRDEVRRFIATVLDKNLEEGIKEAASSKNPALMDAFHDILVDELYGQLIERRKLQKID